MLGGTYALLGIGLTLIFGIMRVVNFTHGELYAFGAYMMYMLVMLTGANFFVALVLALALVSQALDTAERLGMKALVERAVALKLRFRVLMFVVSVELNERPREASSVCELKFAASVALLSVPTLPIESVGCVAAAIE